MPKSINNVSVGYKFDIRKGDVVTYRIRSRVNVPDVNGTCIVHHINDAGVVWVKTARLGVVPLGSKEVTAHSYCNRSLRIKATALVKATRAAFIGLQALFDGDTDGFTIDTEPLAASLRVIEEQVKDIPNATFPHNTLR